MVKITLWVWIAAILMLSVSETHTLADDVFAQATAWSPDGQFVAVGMSDGTLHIVDAVTLSIVNTFDTDHGSVRALAWEKIGTRLAVGADHEIIIWDSVIQLELARINTEAGDIDSLSWSPDGVYLASSSQNGFPDNVQIWDISAQRKIFSPVVGDVLSVAWSPDSSQLAITKFGEIQLWNVLEQVQTNIIHTTEYSVDLVWSRDGLSLASGDGYAPGEATVRLWDADSGRLLRSFIGHRDAITEVDWSIDGEWLATSSHDGTVRIWNALSGDTVQLYEGLGSSFGVAFSPYGGRLAYGQTFNPGSSEPPFQIVVPAPSLERLAAIAALCVRDGDFRAESLTDSAPTVLDDLPAFVAQVEALPEGAIPSACRADLLAVASALSPSASSQDASDEMPFVEWSPNGKLIAYWNERDFRLVDVETGKAHGLSLPLSGVVNDLDWSPDGDRMVIGTSEGEVQIWQVDVLSTDEVVIEKLAVWVHGTVRDLDGNETGVSDVDWSPSGSLIASTSGVGGDSLQIWDAQTYTKRFAAQASSVAGMVWNETGTELAVASVNGLRILTRLHFTSSTPVVWSNEIWQSQTNNLGREIPEQRLSNPIWDASNRTIVVTTWFGEMWLVDTANGSVKQLAVLDQTQALGQSHRYLDVIFDPLTSEYIGLIRYSYPNDIYHQIIGLNNYSNQVDLVLPDLPHNITLSPYGGRLAYGQSFDPDSEEAPFQIVIPASSLDRLAAITALCVRDGDARAESLTDSAPTALDDLPAFVAQVEALPDGAIPPACRADVLAVASALGN